MRIRKPAIVPPAFASLDPAQMPGVCTRRYAVTLVTPMYGGGVKAGEVDIEMPIRVSAIRGQLRFWWRLLNGHDKTSKELFVEERALWGGLGSKPEEVTASRVRLMVSKVQKINSEKCAEYKPNKNKNDGSYKTVPEFNASLSPYALFSAQGELSDDKKEVVRQSAKLIQSGMTFELHVSLLKADAEEFDAILAPVLRFWASFGGLGARTRRGLGSIRIDDLQPVTQEEAKRFGCKLVLSNRSNPKDANPMWVEAIKKIKTFRQDPGFARNGTFKEPGRSRWPEPDAIREITNAAADQHPIQDWYPGKLFPRALFGLPIIFQFKDEKKKKDKSKNPGDPRKTSLSVDGADRFASPLIIKAYWNGCMYQPAAILLPSIDILRRSTLSLTYTGVNPPRSIAVFAPGQWWPAHAQQVLEAAQKIQPLRDNGGGDPLDAFLKFFIKD